MNDTMGLGFSDVRPPTALHAAAATGARDMAQKAWQEGLDAAVSLAAEGARRRGLDLRGQRRAATRMAAAYVRKHPRP